jgi:hypothetical protein
MKTIDELRQALPAKHEREKLETIAQATGVSYHTLLKVVNGATQYPRYHTAQKLFAYVEQTPA